MNLNQVALYAPYIGGSLVTFGLVRILMRSEVDFSRGTADVHSQQKLEADRAAIWNAIWSPTGRFDLVAMVLGLAVIFFFVASIS